MTIEQIDRTVREANPVPDLKALEPLDLSVLHVTQQRSGDMQTQDKIQSDREPMRPNRGLLIGMAAAAVVLIGALAIFLNREEAPVAEETPPVETMTPEPTVEAAPIEVATGFVEAYAAFDAETAASYLAADADLSGLEGGQEAWRQGLDFWEATGLKVLLSPCEEVSVTPSGTTAVCPFDYHGIRSDELGVGPFTGNRFDFTLVDGKIVSATMRLEFQTNGFSAQVWEPFSIWIAETYPEDVAIMYTNPNANLEQLTEESIALWEQRSREYVAIVAESTAGETTP